MGYTNESNQSKGVAVVEPEPQTPQSTSSVERKVTPQTGRSNEEFDNLNKVASDLGREVKELKGQLKLTQSKLSEYESRITRKDSEIEKLANKRETLEKQIDELSSDDPEMKNFVKKLKEVEVKEDKLNADMDKLKDERNSFESYKNSHATWFEKAQDRMFADIAGEYENASPEKLKNLCQTFKATTEEAIRTVADNIWDKVKEDDTKNQQTQGKTQPKPVHVPSGNRPGGDGLLSLSPKERVEEADRRLRNK